MKTSTEWVYGYHAVHALLSVAPERVKVIFLQSQHSRSSELRALAHSMGIAIQPASAATLAKLVGEDANHQGVACQCQPLTHSESDLNALLEQAETEALPPLVLVLDGVEDPHNLGACLRSANIFGAVCVLTPKDRAAPLTAVACKVASGAAVLTPVIRVTNLARTLRELKEKGFWIVGLAGEGAEALSAVDCKGPIVLVLGREGEGLREITRKQCDFLAYIPMHGAIESLNVSAAAAIALYETRRQQATL
ncbi:MAG: 23S rRNA (guanosine(2251)-2'-O)-methyltransferase RlmB [Gammaproteobacteria bacterium RIFCSPHIGHO2_12_FULL_45_9]|nr:MAG: 23S rRNA (guanosine(2251)-2'-O)-methyltransferase RlmB [Gammaproteobacteria bacterium RIFCSPHIGHO2_12_FULL_45_9]